jgi:hypothetical protein
VYSMEQNRDTTAVSTHHLVRSEASPCNKANDQLTQGRKGHVLLGRSSRLCITGLVRYFRHKSTVLRATEQ